ncbi:MAG: class II fumarate hydratase [Mariprofundales bacterium]|nr:class II fumarate hydratase [Mariprofundales bacterium]
MRKEYDSMGEMEVPESALYGAQTARALINFPVSGIRFRREFIQALGEIKRAAAVVNDRLTAPQRQAITAAADEVINGELDEHFVLDIFQTGSGTSTNMNANEVIAHRAQQIAPQVKIHPNDHVNMGQSSNDVIPTALHLSAAALLVRQLLPALEHLEQTLQGKAVEFAEVIKIGRTHLMDATPITLGQEVSGWARQVALGIERLRAVLPRLCELAQGGTAVGTGLNSSAGFGAAMAAELSARYGMEFVEAVNHFEAQAAQDGAVELSGQLRTVAVSLMKIANDVRLLNAGPRCGLGELKVPAVQPGSSIMPGKVNPVMAESLAMVCAQVMGNDVTIGIAGGSGLLDLNVMLPLISHNLLESEVLLANSCRLFADRCLVGMEADSSRCAEQIEWSMAMVTTLAPVLGYDVAARLAKQALQEQKSVRQLCEELHVLSVDELDRLLDPVAMLAPDGEKVDRGWG